MAHLVVSNRKVENVSYFRNPEELEAYLKLCPEIDTLIFAFWSWIVQKWMLDTYKCYGLHTGPLLEGRGKGGSPIDNLKALGVKMTTLCAFEMNEGVDDGKVKIAIPLYLNCSKDLIIYRISHWLPIIAHYLTAIQPEIPERFQRIANAK